jgi:hypothetical protein
MKQYHKKNSLSSSSGVFIYAVATIVVGAMVACSPDTGVIGIGKKNAERKGDDGVKKTDPASVFDQEKTCGTHTPKADEDPDMVLFNLKLESLPFVSSGNQMGVSYAVTLKAEATIEQRAKSGSKSEAKISIVKIDVDAKSPLLKLLAPGIVRSKAQAQVSEQNEPESLTSMSTGEWLNIVSSEGPFKDLLCGIPPIKVAKTKGATSIEYSPGLPDTVNPLAPRETLEKEIGKGRSFNITAKVISAGKKGPPAGDYPTTVTVVPFEPTYLLSDGTTLNSDLAYKITVKAELPKGEDPISSVRIYFINLKEQTLDGVIDETQAVKDGKKSPIVQLLRVK